MRYVVRWWEALGRPERIVAISLGFAAPVAIVNSTVWAIAVCYMARQKAIVEIERVRAGSAPSSSPALRSEGESTPLPAHGETREGTPTTRYAPPATARDAERSH